MKKETLQALGLKAVCDVPVQDMLNRNWESLSSCGIKHTPTNRRKIEAVIELLRTPDERNIKGTVINCADDIADVFRNRIRFLNNERLWMVTIAGNNHIINEYQLTEGTNDKVLIDTKTITKTALMDNARGIILLHNHPSGNPKPSFQDISMTKDCRETLKVFDIRLLDHIILATDSFYSFDEEQTKNYPSEKNKAA